MLAYLLLGSNLGPRRRHLAWARRALRAEGLRLRRLSSLYATRALPEAGAAAQPWYLNQVVEAETALDPVRLLRRLQHLERQAGRPAPPRRGAQARTLDLDLIAYGRLHWNSPVLALPHPRWRERPFLLALMSELFPRGRAAAAGLAWTPPLPDASAWRRLK